MTNNVETITISGRITRDKFFAEEGDVYIYRQDDRNGSKNRQGRHSNYGYSGYFLASIYDGKKWRKLQFNKLVFYENRFYETAREAGQVERDIAGVVSKWAGLIAHYDSTTRSFRIHMMEVC